MPTTWAALFASLLVTGGPGGTGPKTVEQLLQEKGPPLLAARSLSLRGKRLVAGGLDLVEPDTRPRGLYGRALVYCDDGWEALGLSVSLVGARMSRATPLLGREGPEGKALTAEAGKAGAVRLLCPAHVLVVWVDAQGRVRRTEAATVTAAEFR